MQINPLTMFCLVWPIPLGNVCYSILSSFSVLLCIPLNTVLPWIVPPFIHCQLRTYVTPVKLTSQIQSVLSYEKQISTFQELRHGHRHSQRSWTIRYCVPIFLRSELCLCVRVRLSSTRAIEYYQGNNDFNKYLSYSKPVRNKSYPALITTYNFEFFLRKLLPD